MCGANCAWGSQDELDEAIAESKSTGRSGMARAIGGIFVAGVMLLGALLFGGVRIGGAVRSTLIPSATALRVGSVHLLNKSKQQRAFH